MDKKQIKIIFILTLTCFIFYFIVIGQINNSLFELNKEFTELDENYKIIESESNSIIEEIESLTSLVNLKEIAKEKNLKKPTKDQIIYIKNDKNKEEK